MHTIDKPHMLNKVVTGTEYLYEIAATNLTVYAVCKRNKCLPIGLGFFLQGALIPVATELSGFSGCLDRSGLDPQWSVAAIF